MSARVNTVFCLNWRDNFKIQRKRVLYWATCFFALLISVFIFGCEPIGTRPNSIEKKPDTPKKPVSISNEKPKPDDKKDCISKIEETSVLRVAMQAGYPPFQMRNRAGGLMGMDVDLANMAAKRLGVQVRIVERSWSGLIDTVLEGEAEVLMSAMTITSNRNKRVLFTDPLLVTGRMFLVKSDELNKIRSSNDLNKSGTFICSTPDGLGPMDFSEIFPKASYREFPIPQAAIEEVLTGRCKAYIDQEFIIRMNCAKQADKVASSFERLTYEPIAFAVRPGETHWLNWLNNFIRQIQHDGSLERLRKKWLHDYYLDLNR